MLVGGNIGTVHGQRWVGVANFHAVYFQIAQYLIVGAILLEDINHVANGIGAGTKFDLAGLGEQEIAFVDPLGELGQIFLRVARVKTGERTVHERGNVRVLAVPLLLLQFADAVVGAGALAFGGRN